MHPFLNNRHSTVAAVVRLVRSSAKQQIRTLAVVQIRAYDEDERNETNQEKTDERI
jgi:hypothetical protein